MSYSLYLTQSSAIGADSMVSVMPKESTNANACGPSSAQRMDDSCLTSVACAKKKEVLQKTLQDYLFQRSSTCAGRRISKVKSCVRFDSSVDSKYSLKSFSSIGAMSLSAEDRAISNLGEKENDVLLDLNTAEIYVSAST